MSLKSVVITLLLFAGSHSAYGEEDFCRSRLSRPFVVQMFELQDRLLALPHDQALDTHLPEYENLVLKMADQISARFPNPEDGAKILRPFLRKISASSTLTFGPPTFSSKVMDLFFGGRYPSKPLVEVLRNLSVSMTRLHLRSIVQSKRLSYRNLLDLSVEWALVMSLAQARDEGREYEMTQREQFRLLEFLNGGRSLLQALFPVTMLAFHQAPLAVDSTVGLTVRAVQPVRLATVVLPNLEIVSPLEEYLHDLFHMRKRLDQTYSFLFPDATIDTFLPDPYNARFQPLEFYIYDHNGAPQFRAIFAAQEAFGRNILTGLHYYSQPIQAAAEIIWFELFFEVFERHKAIAKGLNSKSVDEGIQDFLKLGMVPKVLDRARSGIYGSRYRALTEPDIFEAMSVLKFLSSK